MRNTPDAEEDQAVGVIGVVPRVLSVSVQPGYVLVVEFDDGVRGKVDCTGMVCGQSAGVFASLRSPALFSAACVSHGAVTWPGDLDLAPDAMHDALAANGHWELV